SVSEFAAALNSIAKTRGISWPSTNTCPRLCAVITIFTSAIAQPRHGDDRRLATIVGRANALDVVRLALVDNAPRRIDFARPDVEPHLLAVGLGTGCDGLGGRAQGVRHLRPHLAVVADLSDRDPFGSYFLAEVVGDRFQALELDAVPQIAGVQCHGSDPQAD